MCIPKQDPSPEKGDTVRRPRLTPGAHATGLYDFAPSGGLEEWVFRSSGYPGLTPPGFMISPPLGAWNLPRGSRHRAL